MSEPLKATFFTLRRRERAVLLPATLVFLAIMALIVAAFVALNWGTFVQLREIILNGMMAEPNSEAASQFVMRVFGLVGWSILFLFPIYMVIAAYEAACLRWMIRGEAPGLFGIVFDNDMWRVYGVYWCWLIAQFAVSTAVSILTMPLMFMTMGEIVNNPTPEAMWRWQLTVQLPLTLLQYIPLIFIGVRFAPGAATSVLRKRFSFLEAWTVTRGRFWALFGSFATLVLLAALTLVIVVAATYSVLIGDLLPAFIADWRSATPEEFAHRLLTPEGLATIGIAYAANGVVFLVYSVMSFGINARAALAAHEEGKITIPEGTA